MKIFHNDGNLFIVCTTGDIKDIRDADGLIKVNYFTDIKDTWYTRLVKKLGIGHVIKPVRAITIANERSYQAWLNKQRGE
jgi:hypothetical protein